MKQYAQFVKKDADFQPIAGAVDITKKLPTGIYQLVTDNAGNLHFYKSEFTHDELIDLPNTEYDMIVSELELFMKEETKKLFKDYGFIYKRSTLLYGMQGSGKTCIVNRIARKHIDRGGIVLFNPNPILLETAYEVLNSIQPETPVLVVFEELDELIAKYESTLLNVLDGEIQKDNIIYMATTNHIDKIPARIRRPGRMSSVIEVNFPSAETRRFYLEKKLNIKEGLNEWVEKTSGFSIDELKETVQAVKCLGYDLETILARIRKNRNIPMPSSEPSEKSNRIDIFGPKKDRYNQTRTTEKKELYVESIYEPAEKPEADDDSDLDDGYEGN